MRIKVVSLAMLMRLGIWLKFLGNINILSCVKDNLFLNLGFNFLVASTCKSSNLLLSKFYNFKVLVFGFKFLGNIINIYKSSKSALVQNL